MKNRSYLGVKISMLELEANQWMRVLRGVKGMGGNASDVIQRNIFDQEKTSANAYDSGKEIQNCGKPKMWVEPREG